MEISRPLRGGLLVYECARLFFLIGAFVALRPGSGNFPWLVYAAPNAMFPLMALFLWLDNSRYGMYMPLYLAGRCIGMVSTAGWLVFSRYFMPDGALPGIVIELRAAADMAVMIPAMAGWVLLGGDLLSAAAGLLIIKKTRAAKTPVREEIPAAAMGGK